MVTPGEIAAEFGLSLIPTALVYSCAFEERAKMMIRLNNKRLFFMSNCLKDEE